MSKGKSKRKREHGKAAVKQNSLGIELLESNKEATHPDAAKSARQEKREPSMSFGNRLRELWRACSLTDRIIAVFTGVLAAAAIYQFIITNGQLDTMRKDQRAWVALSVSGDPQISEDKASGNVTISWGLILVNTGKTLARHSSVEAVVDTVRNGDAPTFAYDNGITWQTDAVVLPNTPTPIVGKMLHKTKIKDQPEETILTHPEYQDLLDGTQYLVVYAKSSYLDIFGTEHWQHFCGFKGLSPKPTTLMGARACTNYNDVDDN
jgi:hypothetical protein